MREVSASRRAVPVRGSYCGGRRCAPTPLRCSKRSRAAQLAALRQARRDRSRGALRAPTPLLRFSPPQKSPPPETPCRENTMVACGKNPLPSTARWFDRPAASTFGSNARGADAPRPRTSVVSAKACPGRPWRACEAPRNAGPEAARVSALRRLTRRACPRRSERSERSELRDGPRARVPQGSRRAAPTASLKRCGLPGRGFARRDRLQPAHDHAACASGIIRLATPAAPAGTAPAGRSGNRSLARWAAPARGRARSVRATPPDPAVVRWWSAAAPCAR